MEHIANHLLNGRSLPNGAPTDTEWSKSSDGSQTSGISERFLAATMEAILKTLSLANSPALTETELGQRSRDWAEVLSGVIPEHRINDAFNRAFRDHISNFPLTAYEVKTAYERIAEEEAANRPADDGKKHIECGRCFGTNFVHVFDLDGQVKGVRVGNQPRCDHRPFGVDEPQLFKRTKPSNVVSINQTQEASR